AAEKVTGAREAVLIYKNADKFASFCNDVIGDISGIISGSALAIVIIEIGNLMNESPESPMQLTLSIVLTSLIAALTVGGKALGKYFAMNASTSILLMTGKAIYFIQEKMKINIFSSTKNNQDTSKELLNRLLVKQNLIDKREKAKRLIMAGQVFSENERLDKPGVKVDESIPLTVKGQLPYVSRGGFKLEKALQTFDVSV